MRCGWTEALWKVLLTEIAEVRKEPCTARPDGREVVRGSYRHWGLWCRCRWRQRALAAELHLTGMVLVLAAHDDGGAMDRHDRDRAACLDDARRWPCGYGCITTPGTSSARGFAPVSTRWGGGDNSCCWRVGGASGRLARRASAGASWRGRCRRLALRATSS